MDSPPYSTFFLWQKWIEYFMTPTYRPVFILHSKMISQNNIYTNRIFFLNVKKSNKILIVFTYSGLFRDTDYSITEITHQSNWSQITRDIGNFLV